MEVKSLDNEAVTHEVKGEDDDCGSPS